MASKIVADFYETSPQMEEDTRLQEEGMNLSLILKFVEDTGKEAFVEIIFRRVAFFSKSLFPGVNSLDGDFGSKIDEFRTGCLIEIVDSALAKKWSEYFLSLSSNIIFKHYVIYLEGVNFVFHFTAQDFETKSY